MIKGGGFYNWPVGAILPKKDDVPYNEENCFCSGRATEKEKSASEACWRSKGTRVETTSTRLPPLHGNVGRIRLVV
jgi:hypothetical protein